jgi:hypothetical protein
MSLKHLMCSAIVMVTAMATAAHAEIIPAKGVATLEYTGFKVQPEVRDRAILNAEINALDRYIAEHNPAKQRIYDQAKPDIVSSLQDYVLGVTVLSEVQDKKQHLYTVSVRADLNANTLENRLTDSAGLTPTHGDAQDIALVFVARSRASTKIYDDKIHKRCDTDSTASNSYKGAVKTVESEKLRSNSIGTKDEVDGSEDAESHTTDSVTCGGSITKKADSVEWTVAESENFDQQLTGAMTDTGYNLVPGAYIDRLDLISIRKDFATGNDLMPQTQRNMVQAIRASGLRYVVVGTMDVGASDRDPVSGNVRVYVSINAKLLDVSGNFPRPVAAIGPEQYSGLGPDESVARTEATKRASQAVAKTLIDRLAVKGVR